MLRNALGVEEARKLSAGSGGRLNPDWVETLMGLPIGWTDLECNKLTELAGWPALMGMSQYSYEPPRTTTESKNRAARLKCLGNAVVPQQAYPVFLAVKQMWEAALKEGSKDDETHVVRFQKEEVNRHDA